MSLYTFYEQYHTVRYRGRLCSTGFLFTVVCSVLAIVLPWLLTYYTGSLWLKHDTLHLPVDVHFRHDAMIALHTEPKSMAADESTSNGIRATSWPHLLWSTFDVFRLLMPDSATALPLVTSEERDTNNNMRHDCLRLRAEFHVPPHYDTVSAVQMLLTFNVYVDGASHLSSASAPRLSIPCLVYLPATGHFYRRTPVGRVDIACNLQLTQRHLVSQSHTDDLRSHTNRISNQLNGEDITAALYNNYDQLTLAAVINEMMSANMSLQLDNCHTVWSPLPPILTPSSGGNDKFVVVLTVHYPDTVPVQVRPGLGRVLHWAWLQYGALLVVFLGGMRALKHWAFAGGAVAAFVTPSSSTNSVHSSFSGY